MKIASRQGKSLTEARRSNTSSELKLWEAFFQWEYNEQTKLDNYLAQIALEVHRTRVEKPNKLTLKDKLIKFMTGKEMREKEEERLTPEERGRQSKAIWLAAFGIKE